MKLHSVERSSAKPNGASIIDDPRQELLMVSLRFIRQSQRPPRVGDNAVLVVSIVILVPLPFVLYAAICGMLCRPPDPSR